MHIMHRIYEAQLNRSESESPISTLILILSESLKDQKLCKIFIFKKIPWSSAIE